MPAIITVWDGVQWRGAGTTTAPTGLPPSPWTYQSFTIGAPAPTSDLLLGMLNSPQNEANFVATEAEWGGTRSGIKRSYSTGMPNTAPLLLSDDYGKRASWHSMKSSWPGMAAGNDAAAMTSFLNSIPADHTLMLTYAHEPENDFPLGEELTRAAEWRAAQAYFYDLVKSVRPQTLVGPILMSWTFKSASGRVWQRWVPPVGKMDFFGLDPYNAYLFPIIGAPTTWEAWPMSGVVTWQAECDRLGVPGAIGETACHEDETGIGPSRKAGWMQDAVDYAVANNYTAFCWFNSYKPGDTAEPMMLNSSQASLDKWSSLLSAHQNGVK